MHRRRMLRMKTSPSAIFVGHGAPTLALSQHPATSFLRALGEQIGKPSAVIMVSPHRQATAFEVGCANQFEAWHDFRGFDPALYKLKYSPPGAPELAQQARELIAEAGLPNGLSTERRIDHGIWVPMRLMWPDQDVPVLPISLLHDDPQAHYQLGQALRPMCTDGVILMASGSITHNLSDVNLGEEMSPASDWAVAFDDWIKQAIERRDDAALLEYRNLAPHARHAHPEEDHLMPLFVAIGAGGTGRALYTGFSYATVSLSAYAFD